MAATASVTTSGVVDGAPAKPPVPDEDEEEDDEGGGGGRKGVGALGERGQCGLFAELAGDGDEFFVEDDVAGLCEVAEVGAEQPHLLAHLRVPAEQPMAEATLPVWWLLTLLNALQQQPGPYSVFPHFRIPTMCSWLFTSSPMPGGAHLSCSIDDNPRKHQDTRKRQDPSRFARGEARRCSAMCAHSLRACVCVSPPSAAGAGDREWHHVRQAGSEAAGGGGNQ
jgi:hypothetical protein